MRKIEKDSLGEYLLSLPALLWLSVLFLFPTLILFIYAFKPYDVYGGMAEGWTFETILSVFNTSYLYVAIRTVWMSLFTTLVCLVLALPMGYYISRAKPGTQSLILLLTIIPFWSSFIIRIYAIKSMLHPEGFIKQLLVFLHLASEDAILLYKPATVIIVMIYTFYPFAILPIYAAASKFDYHLMEAALDLGLTRFKAFIKIFIPGIRTGLITAFLMVFIPCLGSYVIPDLVGGPQTEMIGNKIVQRTFTDRNLPQAAALSAILTLTVLIPMAAIAIMQMRAKKRELLRGH